MYVLTLLCSSLLASPHVSSCFFLAVAPQRPQGHFRTRLLSHGGEELRVAHSAMGAVRAEDGGAHVLLHLSAAELALSAQYIAASPAVKQRCHARASDRA